MQDRELYREILESPWEVERGELRRAVPLVLGQVLTLSAQIEELLHPLRYSALAGVERSGADGLQAGGRTVFHTTYDV